jgi:subtilisin family serine protease
VSAVTVDKKEKSSAALTDKANKRQNATKTNSKEGSLKDKVNANSNKVKQVSPSGKVKKSKIKKKAPVKTTPKQTDTSTKSTGTTVQTRAKKYEAVKGQKRKTQKDEIIVKFKPNAQASTIKDKLALKTVKKLGSIGAEVIKVPAGKSADSLIAALKADPSVLYAQPNYIYYPDSLPNDARFTNLWGLHNTGQFTDYVPDMDIDLPEALEHFNASATRNELVVAVIDTGIDINHPDLQDKIWTNPNEVPGNGVDDDRNGYVDDVNGWDFFNFDNTVYDPNNFDHHGTHVAGTIAAATNNSIGVAGIAPNVKIMPLKFLGPDGGSTEDAILAVEYAAKMGVKITNNSWGGGAYDQALHDAIQNSNSLFIAAAGNDSLDNDEYSHYPASYELDNVLSIAALNGYGELADFSNFGAYSVDMAAPGDYIESTVPKMEEFGAAAQIDNGTYKVIFNGFGFESITDSTQQVDAFKKAMTYLGATTTSSILLVQDDESDNPFYNNYLATYEDLLTGAGFPNFTTQQILTDKNGPSASQLNQYDIVIWFSGDAYGAINPTLTSADTTALTSYLNAGGNLLLSGQDLLWRNTESSFVLYTLGLQVVAEQERTSITGVEGTIYAGLSAEINGAYYADLLFSNSSSTTVNVLYPADANYDNAYAFNGGTSMATPHVSGVAALMYGLKPELSPVEAKNILMQSGDSLETLNGTMVSGKTLNAYNALTLDPTTLDNDVPGVALPSEVVTDSLNQSSDTDDVFAVNLNKGETIKATLSGDTGTDFDLYLFDPSTKTVQNSTGMITYSETVDSSTESIEYTATSAGTYYIDVYAYAGYGNYTLTVSIGNGPGEYENNSPTIVYEGNWPLENSISHSSGNAQYTNTAGSASFSFIGDEIEWIGYKNTNQGFADVYIDGKLTDTISLFASTPQTKVTLLKKNVPYGNHTVKIAWTGKRDPLARKSGTNINLDKLIVRENLVPPLAPANVTVTYDTFELAPIVKWTLSSDALGYKVYRKEASEASFTALHDTATKLSHFIDRTAVSGKSYQYYVVAYGIKDLASAPSNTVTYLFDDNAPGAPLSGTTATGSLTFAGDDVDVWAVPLEAGKTYNFSFNGPSGTTDFDYALFSSDTTDIYGAEPVRLVEEIGSEEYFTYPVTNTGTYFVAAYTYEGSGDYTITVGSKTTVADDDIPGVPLKGTTAEVSDFLDPYDMDDVYLVELGKGDTITVNLSSPATNYNDFDLYLYGPSSTTVIYDSPAYINSVAHSYNEDTSTESVTYIADVAGKYYVDVNWFGGSGIYDLIINIKKAEIPSEQIVTRVENNDSNISYSGSWTLLKSSSFSGGSINYSNQLNSYFELEFTGTGIKWFAYTSPTYGIADVFIDGEFIAQVDLYSSLAKYKVLVFEKQGLPQGIHTIKIVNSGKKNPSAKNTYINLDAFDFFANPDPIITLFEDNDPNISYTGSWLIMNSSSFSGKSIHYSNALNSVIDFNFFGTGIRWLAYTSPSYGIADVFIDDIYIGTVDLYSSTTKYKNLVFEKLNLPKGSHTLKIVNNGKKNSNAKNTYLNIDLFETIN